MTVEASSDPGLGFVGGGGSLLVVGQVLGNTVRHDYDLVLAWSLIGVELVGWLDSCSCLAFGHSVRLEPSSLEIVGSVEVGSFVRSFDSLDFEVEARRMFVGSVVRAGREIAGMEDGID